MKPTKDSKPLVEGSVMMGINKTRGGHTAVGVSGGGDIREVGGCCNPQAVPQQ